MTEWAIQLAAFLAIGFVLVFLAMLWLSGKREAGRLPSSIATRTCT